MDIDKEIKQIKSWLSELNSDYKNKEKFHQLSELSQRVIIHKIDELEDRFEKLKSGGINWNQEEDGDEFDYFNKYNKFHNT